MLLVACRAPVRPAEPIVPGVTIALYGGASPYAVVDERRWLALDGDELVLDHVAPDAELATLWISSPGVAIDRCTRPELVVPPPSANARTVVEPSPVVRCRVAGARGRRLVRVVYVTKSLAARTEHAIAIAEPERARVTTRFAVPTPRWNERGELVVFGDPSGASPRELARGDVPLDGSIAVLAAPARDVPAHLRRIYTGAVPSPGFDSSLDAWHAESTTAVWVWLELDLAELAPGALHVHVELPGEAPREVDAPRAISDGAGRLRVPLWIDPELAGTRDRVQASTAEDGQRVEQLTLAVANLGAVLREVWIEEQARPGPHRRLTGARPSAPAIHGDVLRSVLQVAPRTAVHVRYTVEYDAP